MDSCISHCFFFSVAREGCASKFWPSMSNFISILDTTTDSQIKLSMVYAKYRKELRCPNTEGKYGGFEHIGLNKYSRLLLSRLRFSRMTTYIEMNI